MSDDYRRERLREILRESKPVEPQRPVIINQFFISTADGTDATLQTVKDVFQGLGVAT